MHQPTPVPAKPDELSPTSMPEEGEAGSDMLPSLNFIQTDNEGWMRQNALLPYLDDEL
jgi:hypothetical protein